MGNKSSNCLHKKGIDSKTPLFFHQESLNALLEQNLSRINEIRITFNSDQPKDIRKPLIATMNRPALPSWTPDLLQELNDISFHGPEYPIDWPTVSGSCPDCLSGHLSPGNKKTSFDIMSPQLPPAPPNTPATPDVAENQDVYALKVSRRFGPLPVQKSDDGRFLKCPAIRLKKEVTEKLRQSSHSAANQSFSSDIIEEESDVSSSESSVWEVSSLSTENDDIGSFSSVHI